MFYKYNYFTQEKLEEFFKDRKNWIIERTLKNSSKEELNFKSINLVVRYKKKFGLSIIAGRLLYSKPNFAKVKKYNSIEIGLLIKDKELIGNNKLGFYEDGVKGYVMPDEFNEIIAKLENNKKMLVALKL